MGLPETALHILDPPLSGGVDHAEGPVLHGQGDHGRHGLVHLRGAQAAPHGNHQLFPGSNTQLFSRCRLFPAGEIQPDRSAGDHHLVGMAVVSPGLLKAHHDPVCFILQHFGGKARLGVTLVDHGGNTQSRRSGEHRVAHIPSGADDHVRLEFTQNPLGRRDGADQLLRRLQVVGNALRRETPAQIGNGNGADLVALPGHQLRFHFPLRADEQDAAVRHYLPQQIRHAHSGLHMSRGAAAGKQELHIVFSSAFSFMPSEATGGEAGSDRETLSTMPHSAIWISSAVPP